jgi:signal transduction histidine kinase
VPVHLLLVDPEADRLAGPLAAELPGLDVTPVATVAAARAYLAGTRFDAVAVREGLDGAGGLDALAAGLGVRGGVHTYGPDDAADLPGALGPRLRLVPAAPASGPPAVAPGALPADVRAALADLRTEIGRVAHDLANPLAVVAGNAQLGAELARALGADPAIERAFADIDEAGQTLAARLGQLAALRARLDAFV